MIGSVSYIPVFGIFFGVVGFIWGLLTKKDHGKIFAAVSFGGIAFSVFVIVTPIMIIGGLVNDSADDSLAAETTRNELTKLVTSIEIHRLIYGRYPAAINGPGQGNLDLSSDIDPDIFYEPLERGQQYYLLSVGQDGKPYTPDDLLPTIGKSDLGKIGLRFHDGSLKP